MAIQGLEQLQALEAHHLPNMEGVYKRVLILECSGRAHEDIAQMEHISAGTVGQWLRIASSEIALCLPAGVRVGKVMRGYWVGRHLDDCLAAAAAELGRAKA